MNYYSYDGCFIDTPMIFSQEEYNTKAIFNNKKALFRQRLIFELGQALAYELLSEHQEYNNNAGYDDDILALSFGDLLYHVPIAIRKNWKQYFVGVQTEKKEIYYTIHDNHLDKLLFSNFLNVDEANTAMQFWNKRVIEKSSPSSSSS
jgi:hypothetical protein